MRKIYWILAFTALALGLFLIAKVGDTMWVYQKRSGYPAMIYLLLLFLLFPLVGLVNSRRGRRR